jgi:hypothetical protein
MVLILYQPGAEAPKFHYNQLNLIKRCYKTRVYTKNIKDNLFNRESIPKTAK